MTFSDNIVGYCYSISYHTIACAMLQALLLCNVVPFSCDNRPRIGYMRHRELWDFMMCLGMQQ